MEFFAAKNLKAYTGVLISP